ncbi:S-adenosylmethionine decarboxylase proenzyme [Aspergillus ochraceoroseus]|uniref:adenosylmethionine decarboxylase n=2 Tax=Aspergillus ochraceoroseus TaxID=138278 RepID=A0A0F8WEQ1_9EURO|nr:S-adenosylmethionine decarboxylase proenzyme [Aspergillus ochraceoroseus]
MSVWNPDNIRDVAESVGIVNLNNDVTENLARDVEYRIAQVLEEALKFMRHSRRTLLTTQDIAQALRVLDVEPLYGYESTRPLRFGEASLGPGQPLFYVEDEEVDFEKLINAPLPRVPREISFTAHWLAVEGVQPSIPQNPTAADSRNLELMAKGPNANSTLAAMSGNGNVAVKPLVKHVLSKELQLYFEKVCNAFLDESSEKYRTSGYASLREDPGLHQLVPYFVQFISEKVTHGLKDIFVLTQVMHMAEAGAEPVASLVPPILTCLIGKQLGGNADLSEQFALRDFSASLLGLIANKYSHSSHTLKPRLARSCLKTLLDPSKPFGAHYGAIIGLQAVGGSEAVRVLIIPNLPTYGNLLKEGVAEDSPRRPEAERVLGVLLGVLASLREGRAVLTNGHVEEMVYIGIPKNYTQSPSSFPATSLTINHEATHDLDSTNAFEGPEKLLEVWFAPSADDLGPSNPKGLKAVAEEIWKDMLDIVNCQVLSIVSSEDVDAYLLSESSMFVWPHKLILKTCGTTTLLSGLPRILEIAALFGGFPKSTAPASRGITVAAAPYRVFYSRKNFLFPDRQRGPHRSWRDEVRSMDKLFLNGSAYMIGKMNGEHWYLYLTEPNTLLTPPATPTESDDEGTTETKFIQLPERAALRRAVDDETSDETLEVLMTDLDEENAKQFYLEHATSVAEKRYSNFDAHKEDHVDVFSNTSDLDDVSPSGSGILPAELTTEGHALGTVVSESCGLSEVYPKDKYPESRIDAYLFTPCGFSANGVIPSPNGGAEGGTHYFTVHVTPEPHCSYASFETNVPHSQNGQTTAGIIQHVVNIFQPGRFTLTVFEAKPGMNGEWDSNKEARYIERQAARRVPKGEHVEGYRRVDRIVHDLDGYDLVFRYYERLDWKGGAPRLGEECV